MDEESVNYDWFKSINDLSGNRVLDALMKFSAQYLIFVVFAVLALLCVLRLRERALRPVIVVASGMPSVALNMTPALLAIRPFAIPPAAIRPARRSSPGW